MGTTQSGTAAGGEAGDAAPKQPPTMESRVKTLCGDPEVERQRVISLLGLDVSAGKDEIVWLDKSFGLQSRCFLVRGERWKGRGKQPVVDPLAGTAFVKALPTWSVEEAAERQRSEAKHKAEAEARASGATEEEATARGEEASENIAVVEWAEPSKQLAREREVLRALQAAEEAGELQLPEDTMLVIPRLLDNVVEDEEVKQLEEEKPGFLVFEDLVAAGFVPQTHLQAISVEDGIAVSRALADLHGALWCIRARLFKEGGKPNEDKKEAFEVEAGKVRATYERLLRGAVAQLRGAKGGTPSADKFEPHIGDVSAAFVDANVGPVLVCHGDPWVHNVLLRRDASSGSVDGVAFVDMGNPLVDLFSFLGTMMDGRELFTKNNVVQSQYEARLRQQLPQTINGDVELFSLRAKQHAYARMLAFFFDVKFWWVKGLSLDNEPCLRAGLAFNVNANITRLAEKEKYSIRNENELQVEGEGGIRKRK